MLGVRDIKLVYTPFSLRYDTPIYGQTAYDARKYSIQNTNDTTLWLTYWREDIVKLIGEFSSFHAKAIIYSGDPALVWSAEYVNGAAPGIIDDFGCAVSDSLAFKLWGSTDIIGKSVLVDDVKRIIRGVFKNDHELILISYPDEDTSQYWHVVELSGDSLDFTRFDVINHATQIGLNNPDNILTSSELLFLVFFMAIIPVSIVCFYGLILIYSYMKKYHEFISRLLVYGLFISLVLALPVLLAFLPGYFIPTRWSDFQFWSNLISQMRFNFREFLVVSPTLRDIEGSILLIRHVFICFLASICAVIVCFRFNLWIASSLSLLAKTGR